MTEPRKAHSPFPFHPASVSLGDLLAKAWEHGYECGAQGVDRAAGAEEFARLLQSKGAMLDAIAGSVTR